MQHELSWIRGCGLEPVLAEFLKTNTGLANPYHGLAHGLRVALSAGNLAEWMGWDNDLVRTATVAGLFHDWGHPGKMGTPGGDRVNVEKAGDKVMSLEDGKYGFSRLLAAEAIAATEFPYRLRGASSQRI